MARTQAADYQHRRDVIVEQAARLFARRGFNGSSVAELATACSISKSLLYHYYPSKEDILYAVMSSHVDQLVVDVDHVLAQPGSPRSQLDALIHAFMEHYVGAADKQKVLLNDLDNLPVPQREAIVARQRIVIDATQSLIVAIEPGLGADPALARVKTMLLFGMINWTHTWYDPAGPIKPGQIADLALGMAQLS